MRRDLVPGRVAYVDFAPLAAIRREGKLPINPLCREINHGLHCIRVNCDVPCCGESGRFLASAAGSDFPLIPKRVRPGPNFFGTAGLMADDANTYQPTAEEYREPAQLLRSAVKTLRTAEGRRNFLDLAQECEKFADSMERAG